MLQASTSAQGTVSCTGHSTSMLQVPMSVCACVHVRVLHSPRRLLRQTLGHVAAAAQQSAACKQTDRQAQEVGHSRSRQVSTDACLWLYRALFGSCKHSRPTVVCHAVLSLPHFWVRRRGSICKKHGRTTGVVDTMHSHSVHASPPPPRHPLAPVSHQQFAHTCAQHCAMLCCTVGAAAPSTPSPFTLTLWEHPHALKLCAQQHAALCHLNVQVAKLHTARLHTGRACSKAEATRGHTMKRSRHQLPG